MRKDVRSVSAEQSPQGKRQHVIEVCNAGGCGHLDRVVCTGKTRTSTNKPRWKR